MEIYLMIGVIGIGIYLIFAYFKSISNNEYSYTIIITTHNCADICEGIVRDLLRKRKRLGNCEIIVIDKYSNDETYEIIKRLSSKYIFSTSKRVQESIDLNEQSRCQIIAVNEDTTYFGAREQLKSISCK